MRRYEISDVDWERIAPLLPGKEGDVGRTAHDNRQFIKGVLWIARSGAPLRNLPKRYGNWNFVFQRFRPWAKKGMWELVFDALQDPDLDWLLIDSIMVRAHQHAAGKKNDSPG